MNRIVYDKDASGYFSTDGVSKSSLDWFKKSPLHYWQKQQGLIPDKSTPEMEWGRVVHAALLESRQDYYVRPDTYESKDGPKPWTNAANWCKEWTAVHSEKPIISRDQHNWLAIAHDQLRKHPVAKMLLETSRPEVSIFGYDPRHCLQLKGRCDLWSDGTGLIADLKTMQCASNTALSRFVADWDIHVQAAMYSRILTLNGCDVKGFYIIALEKSDIPRLNVRLLRQSAIDLGQVQLDRLLTDLAECIESDEWPGYDNASQLDVIDLPQWCYSIESQNLPELTIGGKEF